MVEETHKTGSDGNTRSTPRSQGVMKRISSTVTPKQGNEQISRSSYQQTRLSGLRSSQLSSDILQKSNSVCQNTSNEINYLKQDQKTSILTTQRSKKDQQTGFSRKSTPANLVRGSTEKVSKQNKKITHEKNLQNGMKKIQEKHGNNAQQNEPAQQLLKLPKSAQINPPTLASSTIIAKPNEQIIDQQNNQEISCSNDLITSSHRVSPDRPPSEIKIVITQTTSNRKNPPKPKTFTLSNLKTSEQNINQIDNPQKKQPTKIEDKSINQIIPSQKTNKSLEKKNLEILEPVDHSRINNLINSSQKPKILSSSKKQEISSQATNQRSSLNPPKSNLPPHQPLLPQRNRISTNTSKQPQTQNKKTHIYIEKKKFIQEQQQTLSSSIILSAKPAEILKQSYQLGSVHKQSLDQAQHFCDDAQGSTSGSVEGGVKTTTTDWDQKNDSAHERESVINLVELKELDLNETQEEDICSKLPSKNLSISSSKFCYEQDDDDEESGPTLQLKITPKQIYKEDDVHANSIVQEESQKFLGNQFTKHRLNRWINEINYEKEEAINQLIEDLENLKPNEPTTSLKFKLNEENNTNLFIHSESKKSIQNTVQLPLSDNYKYCSAETLEQLMPSLSLNFPFSSAFANQESILQNQKMFSESAQSSPGLFESAEQLAYDLSNSRFSLEDTQFIQQEDILSQPFEIQQTEETNKPSIIQIKGRNGNHFEINITQAIDLSSEFDRLAASSGFSVEDIYITKIALFSNLSDDFQQNNSNDDDDDDKNNIYKQQLEIITLEHALWEINRHEDNDSQIINVEMLKDFLKNPIISNSNGENEFLENSNSSTYFQQPTTFTSFNHTSDWSNNNTNSAFYNRNITTSPSHPFYNQSPPLYCGFPNSNNQQQYYTNGTSFFEQLMQPQPQKFMKPHLLMQQTIRSARNDEIKENERSYEFLDWNKKSIDRKQKNSGDYLQESSQQYPFQFFYPTTTRISRNKDSQVKEGTYMSQNLQQSSGKKSRAPFATQSKRQVTLQTPSPIISTVPQKSRQTEMMVSPSPSSNSLWSNSPYLLDSSNPCNKTPPSSSNNLFSSDLLNQLAQLGQPVN